MTKICPNCSKIYADAITYCPEDGTPLVDVDPDVSHDPLIGQTLDHRWDILSKLGEGSMGAVYLASQRSMRRAVAIKTLRPALSHDANFVQRFFREAQVASSLANPHCVTLYDFGKTHDNLLYFAMEYLEGTTLHERIYRSPLSLQDILTIGLQITVALAAAHDQKIIHRDLKPENIWLLSMPDNAIFVKVLDFGIAKVLDDKVQMTRAGDIYGTPSYMSPEQCRGKEIDARSDLYSLGCVLYEMLVGRAPFESDNIMDIVLAQMNTAPTPVQLASTRTDLPADLVDLCMELLEKSPADRPATASEVGQRLAALLQQTTNTHAAFTPNPTNIPPVYPAPISRGTLWDTQSISASAGEVPADNAEEDHSMPLIWILVLTLVGLIIALGMIGSVALWISQGSPEILFEENF